jgi:recombination protein RecT
MSTQITQSPNATAGKPDNSFMAVIAQARQRFLSVLPEDVFIREANFAMQAITANPVQFQKCDVTTLRSAVENIAFTGLTLNPIMKLAYLIPRKNKIILEPSYKGLIKLLTDGGAVKKVSAVVVYEDEEFQYDPATRTVVKHVQKYSKTEKEHVERAVLGAYSCAIMSDSSLDYEFMPNWELEKIRSKSDGANSPYSPWQGMNWADEMRKKSVIKRHYKLLPLSEKQAKAIDLDNEQFESEKPLPAKPNIMELMAGTEPQQQLPEPVAEAEIVPEPNDDDFSEAQLNAEIERQDKAREANYASNEIDNPGTLFQGSKTKGAKPQQ